MDTTAHMNANSSISTRAIQSHHNPLLIYNPTQPSIQHTTTSTSSQHTTMSSSPKSHIEAIEDQMTAMQSAMENEIAGMETQFQKEFDENMGAFGQMQMREECRQAKGQEQEREQQEKKESCCVVM
jgi:hypothetical protein